MGCMVGWCRIVWGVWLDGVGLYGVCGWMGWDCMGCMVGWYGVCGWIVWCVWLDGIP